MDSPGAPRRAHRETWLGTESPGGRKRCTFLCNVFGAAPGLFCSARGWLVRPFGGRPGAVRLFVCPSVCRPSSWLSLSFVLVAFALRCHLHNVM